MVEGTMKQYQYVSDGLTLMKELAEELTKSSTSSAAPPSTPNSQPVIPAPSQPVTSTSSLNWSSGQKVGYGFLNLLIGSGSFFGQKDWKGGLLIGGLELAGLACLWTGLNSMSYYDPNDSSQDEWRKESYDNGIIWLSVGVGVYAVGAIIGFVRPFSYDKNVYRRPGTIRFRSAGTIDTQFSLTPVSTKNGVKLGLLCNMSL